MAIWSKGSLIDKKKKLLYIAEKEREKRKKNRNGEF